MIRGVVSWPPSAAPRVDAPRCVGTAMWAHLPGKRCLRSHRTHLRHIRWRRASMRLRSFRRVPATSRGGGRKRDLRRQLGGSAVTTSLADVETLKRAAVEMIAEAWNTFVNDHVVPCSRYRPYIQVGRDYEGTALMGCPAFVQFSTTLKTLYPGWFDATPGASPRWYAENLSCRFVDACVAELSLRGETGDAPSDAVEAMVLELGDYLDAPGARVACTRRVSHLMTEDREELSIGGVTILAYRQWEEIRQIAEVMPTARSAFNSEPPQSFASPQATLVS